MIELLSFCTATFRKSLAKVTLSAAAPPLRTSILKTACCTFRRVSLLDTTLWKISLAGIANGPNEVREFQRLSRSFTELADNAQWVTDNHGKMVHATEDATEPVTPDPRAQSMSPQ
jgi:hypothetical protein